MLLIRFNITPQVEGAGYISKIGTVTQLREWKKSSLHWLPNDFS
jgi:hypothetical protein